MTLTHEQRKVKARGAHHKGKGFQRKIAKILSEWYYGDPSILKSTPRSGGYRNKLVGDIVNLENPDDFIFHIECKAQEGQGQKGWNLQQLLQPNSIIEQWWEKTVEDAKITGNIPTLIFTRNYEKNYVVLPWQFGNIPKPGKATLRYFRLYMIDEHSYASPQNSLNSVPIFILEDFLSAFTLDEVKIFCEVLNE